MDDQITTRNALAQQTVVGQRIVLGQRLRLALRRYPTGFVAGTMVLLLLAAAVTSPWITPYDPYQPATGPRLNAPGIQHLMGTDGLGRDQFSRIITGSTAAMLISLSSVVLGVVLGSAVGLVSGWAGGVADEILQRGIDALMAFPGLVLAMALAAMLGTGADKIVLALSVFTIPGVTRTVRGSVLATKTNAYIEAAQAIGSSPLRTLMYHVLPNIISPVIVIASMQIGVAILSEAALSFVGLGIQPPAVSWGQMLNMSAQTYMEAAPWLVIFPMLAISIAVLSVNFLGDALRDALDPRLRDSGRS